MGHLKCRCDIKIPLDELNFYLDQKSTRLLFISNNVDLNGSVEMRIRLERDERKQARQQLQLELIQGNSTCQNNDRVIESLQENLNKKLIYFSLIRFSLVFVSLYLYQVPFFTVRRFKMIQMKALLLNAVPSRQFIILEVIPL